MVGTSPTKFTVFLGEGTRSHKKVLIAYLKILAKRHIEKRVDVMANRYDFKYKRVSIKDQSSRWGSCSSLKNLNFNWRLTFAPKSVVDYVIVHELAHTKRMDHSSKFWDIVEDCMPNYEREQDWLKENARELSVR